MVVFIYKFQCILLALIVSHTVYTLQQSFGSFCLSQNIEIYYKKYLHSFGYLHMCEYTIGQNGFHTHTPLIFVYFYFLKQLSQWIFIRVPQHVQRMSERHNNWWYLNYLTIQLMTRFV